jgi:lactoylglutathione lyase
MVHVVSVRTVGVPVTDQDRALDFYVGVLGFEKRVDAPFGPGLRWIEVGVLASPPPPPDTTIALAPSPEGNPVGVDTGVRLHTTDAAADHADLAGQGVAVDDLMNFPGVPPMFSFRDPDGNTLYLVEAMA